jgi:hypothetical protein
MDHINHTPRLEKNVLSGDGHQRMPRLTHRAHGWLTLVSLIAMLAVLTSCSGSGSDATHQEATAPEVSTPPQAVNAPPPVVNTPPPVVNAPSVSNLSPSAICRTTLLYYGWHLPASPELTWRNPEMAGAPFDSSALLLPVDRKAWLEKLRTDTGNQVGWQIFRPVPLPEETFEGAVNDLLAAGLPKTGWRWWLPLIPASGHTAGLRWSDDHAWTVIEGNLRHLGWLMAETDTDSVLFDPEHYGHTLFQGSRAAHEEQLPYESLVHLVRRRGQQVITALADELPTLDILALYGYSLAQANPQSYDLLAAFYDGILDGLPTNGRLIDGFEQAYGYKSQGQFLAGRTAVWAARDLSAVPDLYTQHVRVGFGLWADYLNTLTYFTPQSLAEAVQTAATVSDGWVWIYSEIIALLWETPEASAYRESLRALRRGCPVGSPPRP